MAFSLNDLVAAAALGSYQLRGDGSAVSVTGVTCDSRSVVPGALFCAIRGGHNDGHAFVPQAVRAGAAAVVVEHPVSVDLDIVQVLVDDSARAAGRIAAAWFGNPSHSMRVIGVTGTNGKTSTTYLLEQLSRAVDRSPGVIGTVAIRYGDVEQPATHTTPDQVALQELLAAMQQHGVMDVAIEVSSHALDQRRVSGTRFAAVCFTNLSQDHLDYHGTLAQYETAKARLFDPEYSDLAIVNAADAVGRRLAQRARRSGLEVWTYGDPDADVHAVDIAASPIGTEFTLVGARVPTAVRVSLPLVGDFNIANALCAITAHLALGAAPETIARGLQSLPQIPGRLERVTAPTAPVQVFVDYAHTADAITVVANALRAAMPASGRLLMLYGCGGDRDTAKRPEMARAAARVADVTVITSDNPRHEDPEVIIAAAVAGLAAGDPKPHVEVDRRLAIEWIVRAARPGDVVVIAGKGHETTQTIGDTRFPFDDRVVAREVIRSVA